MKPEFKYAISYKCKSEEEQNEIRTYLFKVGYVELTLHTPFEVSPYILINFAKQRNTFGTNQTSGNGKQEEIQSKELFLALACCSNIKEGIEGEYWKCIQEAAKFTKGKLYKAEKPISNLCAFLDDNNRLGGFFGYNHQYFVKATKEEIETFLTPKQVMKKSVTINKSTLLAYIQNAQRDKPSVVPLLKQEFPDLWEEQFIVTKEFYNKVLKEIGNCPTWIEKLKQDFKEFYVSQYEFVEGEEVFYTLTLERNWSIGKYGYLNPNNTIQHCINGLDDSVRVANVVHCIPVKAVFPQYPYPQLGIHY